MSWNLLPITLLTVVVAKAACSAEQGFQTHASIFNAVNNYIAQSTEHPDYEVSIAPLDNLLKLSSCPEPLEAFAANKDIRPGRNSIGVRCNSGAKWFIFTSAIVKYYDTVFVSAKPLLRGETITAEQLSMERKDVSSLRGDYLNDIATIANKQVVRPIPAGTILSKRHLDEPKLVKRGDKISISYSRPDFFIRMNGLAMMDGIKGQVIKIKNESSGRIITATVLEPGLVVVNR